jgi:hypothetical protein
MVAGSMTSVSGAADGGGFGAGVGGGVGLGGGVGTGAATLAACRTACGKAAIFSVPFRSPAVFTSAANAALPLPVISGLTTRTHETSLDALHLHPAVADTATVKGPPSGETREDELPSSKRHGAAA